MLMTDPERRDATDRPDLPVERPIAMPTQDLHQAPPSAPLAHPRSLLARRLVLIVGAAIIGFGASCGIAYPLALDGFDVIDQILTITSLSLFAWIGFGFLNALIGFVVLNRHGSFPSVASGQPARPTRPTAVLVPVYNEDVAALSARLARMIRSLQEAGAAHLFDFFILSDSRASAETSERAAMRLLRSAEGPALYYRRRAVNTARKPGNITEWLIRFGGGYEAMLVLDADSVMSADAMLRLAGEMEANPRVALIQTNPLLTGGRTLFARWQQFAAALYSPIGSAGLAWWSGDEATFWGHNAIIRVRAFAESCGLPKLSGPEPLGGQIMSHDMVEAALLRRRGWSTRLMLLDEGSYEECPPTMIDHAVRDRRWCQGNLQHLRLLDTAGLHWISRLQLLMGASAYLTSPLWLLLLVTGLLQTTRGGTSLNDLGTPVWLIGLTLVLLFGPKILALLWAARDRKLVGALGGWRAIWRGVAVDVPLSIVAAPMIMASQCLSIADILAGRPSGWQPQRRDTDGIPLVEALDYYRWHMLLGLLFWIVAVLGQGGAIWQLPVALGLLGAPFLATATSRADWGVSAAAHGIFPSDPGEGPIQRGGPRRTAKLTVSRATS
ncbi:glucans biosynthesis glucosyltransferase MdoH [Sphingomonas sp.]|uniref:glucans biosynthesis glucosyltransferase MdoH n=1 Tax=Sphingomonas sp. TaxID=28214 RepID=UPI003B3A7C84